MRGHEGIKEVKKRSHSLFSVVNAVQQLCFMRLLYKLSNKVDGKCEKVHLYFPRENLSVAIISKIARKIK